VHEYMPVTLDCQFNHGGGNRRYQVRTMVELYSSAAGYATVDSYVQGRLEFIRVWTSR
jgi:hypothetical protein